MSSSNLSTDICQLIDFEKYLKCPKCKKIEFYCNEHKKEVEKILNQVDFA